MPRADEFCPDIVLVSARFDSHANDPLASMDMSAAGFRRLAEIVVDDGRIALFLEGGYDLEGLTESVAQCVDALDDVW